MNTSGHIDVIKILFKMTNLCLVVLYLASLLYHQLLHLVTELLSLLAALTLWYIGAPQSLNISTGGLQLLNLLVVTDLSWDYTAVRSVGQSFHFLRSHSVLYFTVFSGFKMTILTLNGKRSSVG